MRQPLANKYHQPDAGYARELMSELQSLGRTIKSVCFQIGVPERTMRDYMNPEVPTVWDYRTQYCVEVILEAEKEKAEYLRSMRGVASGEEHRV